MKHLSGIMIVSLLLFSACHKADPTGTLHLHIDYAVNGGPLVCDSLCYVNEAGNHFMINEIQWFLSHIELQNSHGEDVSFGDNEDIHYIDTDLPETHLLCSKPIPQGHYSTIHFTFGLNEADNYTGHFQNPPESNMFWPEPLGGGYHHLKLNGKWLNQESALEPVNIHLGTGQNKTLTEFYPNHFDVYLPVDLEIKSGQTLDAYLTMNIDNWFQNPNVYDFNTDGTAIMQKQESMAKIRDNGHDVFSIHTEPSVIENLSRPVTEFLRKAGPKPHFFTKENMGKLLSDLGIPTNKKP